MVYTWHHFIKFIIIVNIGSVVSDNSVVNAVNWRLVEALVEQHPYIVALLNVSKEYLCTGTVINKKAVLTSGSCIVPELYYITVKSAVVGKTIDNNILFKIASTIQHVDYMYELKSTDPNLTKMHSNIGIVISAQPSLDAFMPAADVGNYFASELQGKVLRTVGYGKVNEIDMVVLQSQDYNQSPCMNPKWYYCVCGYEVSEAPKEFGDEFGMGGPVFLGSELVGVSGTPSGLLELKTVGLKYNIFTILGPYISWIDKITTNYTGKVHFRARSNAQKNKLAGAYYILLAVIKILD